MFLSFLGYDFFYYYYSRTLTNPINDLDLISTRLYDALYNEHKIVALRYMNFIMYHLKVRKATCLLHNDVKSYLYVLIFVKYAVSDRSRPTLEHHLNSCNEELTKYIIELILSAFLYVQRHLITPTASDWTCLLLISDWIAQTYTHDSHLLNMAIEAIKIFGKAHPNKDIHLELQRIHNILDQKPSADVLLHQSEDAFLREPCPMCTKLIPLKDNLKAVCPDNHIWGKFKDHG
jgi:hypothetical protein